MIESSVLGHFDLNVLGFFFSFVYFYFANEITLHYQLYKRIGNCIIILIVRRFFEILVARLHSSTEKMSTNSWRLCWLLLFSKAPPLKRCGTWSFKNNYNRFRGKGTLRLFTTYPTIHCCPSIRESGRHWLAPGLNVTAGRLIWSFDVLPFHSGILC